MVPGTLVNAELMYCRSPAIINPMWTALAEVGMSEAVQVTLNGQDYTSSSAMFHFFDKTLVHVSELVPPGGPLAGGTEVTLLGSGFAEHDVQCTVGVGSDMALVKATVLNSSAMVCIMPERSAAGMEPIEVTLNRQVEAHTLTSDFVAFAFYDTSDIRIDSVAPLGGPAEGGTLVTLTGAGYVDRGGVYCRFGADPASTVPASISSSSELRCLSPTRSDSVAPFDAPERYSLVHPMASCCNDATRATLSAAARPLYLQVARLMLCAPCVPLLQPLTLRRHLLILHRLFVRERNRCDLAAYRMAAPRADANGRPRSADH